MAEIINFDVARYPMSSEIIYTTVCHPSCETFNTQMTQLGPKTNYLRKKNDKIDIYFT